MKTSDLDLLSQRIEQLVREHIATCRRVAREALERGFDEAHVEKSRVPVKRPQTTQKNQGSSLSCARRSGQQMQQMSQRLLDAICAKPGETWAAVHADLQSTAIALQRPMAHLRAAGKVKSIGQRNLTRYFPLGVH